ncbi:hypothetical protein ALC62_12319 [Cyphomyrmex costatus]|uniref:USP domain-containing protein n=1 Tax=Cyphomyrmex costatus TaxID=456900 RepID=A0A151IBG6_9HYME|nr:hypothetical protein ALC62_12319 [Cyphomyrmex costatus]
MQYNFLRWNNVSKLCKNCNSTALLEKTSITITKRVLIIQLLLFKVNNEVLKITNLHIKSIPSSKICIGNNIYKVNSAILHHGKNINKGHYKNLLRVKGTKWTSVNDLKVEICKWPRSAKNAYIFLLEQI